jgi:predicted phage terminase large subunit-like protein
VQEGGPGECPVPRQPEGNRFKRSWFELVDPGAVPHKARRVRYWDRASLAGEGDFTAGVLMARGDDRTVFIEDVVRGQWSVGERDGIMRQTADRDGRRYGRTVHTWVEQEPGSGGKESALSAIKLLAGYIIKADKVTGSKVVRAEPFAAAAEGGTVKLVRGSWNAAFLDEVTAFPNGQNDDQLDAAAGGFAKLALPRPHPITKTRVLPLRTPRKGVQGLRIVIAAANELPHLCIDDVATLLLVLQDPPGAALPEHSLPKVLDTLALRFADLDPSELQGRWDVPLEPYGILPEHLLMTREQGKQLWRFIVRRRDPVAGCLVLVDDGGADRRAESIALGLAAMLREPPATIHKASDPEWKPGEDSAPNPYLFGMARDCSAMVVC